MKDSQFCIIMAGITGIMGMLSTHLTWGFVGLCVFYTVIGLLFARKGSG